MYSSHGTEINVWPNCYILPQTRLQSWSSAEQPAAWGATVLPNWPGTSDHFPAHPTNRWKTHTQILHPIGDHQCGIPMDVLGWLAPYKIPYVAITSANTCGHSKGKEKGYSLCRVKLYHFPGLSALFQCSIVPEISQTWNSIVWHHDQLNCMCIHNMFNCTSCITLQTNEMLVWQRTEPLMLATHVHTHRQTQAPTHRHTHTHNVNTSMHMHAVE